MRTIGVVTVGRSDYGIYLPVLKRIQAEPELRLLLYVSGTHLSPEFGLTVQAIEDDGFDTEERVEMLVSSDTAEGISKSMGLGTIGFAQSYARRRPDFLLVLGDRFEMHAAVAAALPFRIPVAHIAGGELTEGALDDLMRHSISKLSHLHFVSIPEYAERLNQMGEEPWRIHVTGSPALDNLKSILMLSRSELEAHLELKLDTPPLLITLHPETQSTESAANQANQLLAALEELALPIVFTSPNNDPGGRAILEIIQTWVSSHPNSRLVSSLGTQRYYSLMSQSAALVGNSSSGIVEAASFELPVVNIGTRQLGRPRAKNVIDVPFSSDEIGRGIQEALSPGFSNSLKGLVNPFGDGRASERICEVLANTPVDQRLLVKRFCDYPSVPNNGLS